MAWRDFSWETNEVEIFKGQCFAGLFSYAFAFVLISILVIYVKLGRGLSASLPLGERR